MKIAIVGAGAMGCLYGAKLSKKNEVYLIDIWKEHVDTINKEGLLIEEKGELIRYNRVTATIDPISVGQVELAVIFVKSPLTVLAMEKNKSLFGDKTVAITLQNGLGNIDLISNAIGSENVIGGTTAHGATMIGPGKIRHAGEGKTIIGELTGEITERIKKIQKNFNDSGMETIISENVVGLVWDKLLINVGINALTGITRLENGRILNYPEIEELLELAVSEGIKVAKAKGIKLSFEDPVAHAKDVCNATSENKSSMLQDILNGKQTEIDMINGSIVREGRGLGIETPVNLSLTNIVKFIQRNEN